MPLSCRTLWLSDIHLGTNASRAEDLLDFLAEVSADKMYLTGDIIDLERMKTRVTFPDAHWHVLMRFFQLARSRTEVIYIPGNHDIEFRALAGHSICGIPIMREASHKTADGKSLLVTHGDLLDARMRPGTGVRQFGAAAYRALVELDVRVNQVRNRFGRKYVPISARLKRRLVSANDYVRQYEKVAADYAATRGFDGIVCGHIHRPVIREINGIRYANDGDWVEHRTALAEADDGSLRIICWPTDATIARLLPRESPLAA